MKFGHELSKTKYSEVKTCEDWPNVQFTSIYLSKKSNLNKIDVTLW